MASIVKNLTKSEQLSPDALAAEIKTAAQRSAARKKLIQLGHSEDEARALLAKTYKRQVIPFESIYKRLGTAIEEGKATPRLASNVTNQLLVTSENENTQVGLLAKLRNRLKKDGASQRVIAATFRPNLTQRRNEEAEIRYQENKSEEITVPERWRDPEAVKKRIETWTKDQRFTGADIADLMVAAAARPGELSTLTIELAPDNVAAGTVTGMAKKRGFQGVPVPYEGALPAWLLRRALETFQKLSDKEQRAAVRQATKFVKSLPEWSSLRGNQLRDLRAFGGYLAVEASGAETVARQMDVRARALRHTFKRPAVAHYSNVA